MKGNMALPQMLARREEAVKNAAALSKSDVNAASAIFSDDMTATKHQQAQSIHAQTAGKISVQQAQESLDTASMESLLQLEQEINNGNVGNNTTVISGQVPDNVV